MSTVVIDVKTNCTFSGRPYLKILEEPQDKFRFRYKTEMQGTHGTILGASTNSLAHGKQKSFPTVKVSELIDIK